MRVLVGMSGGVDSSYAALKLIEEGYEVEGAYLVMHEYADGQAAEYAAKKLGIPLTVIDCRERFDKIVREDFVSEYKNGRTPNPCIVCNPLVKFAALAEYARDNGFDRIATGHYARISEKRCGDRVYHALEVAKDASKDQTYMLYRLGEDVLSMLILPLGDLTKAEVRDFIKESEFSEFDRADSQEICFIPDGKYADYIEERAGKCPEGDFIDALGAAVGKHKGIIRYTVGQRKGLGVSLGERVFVTEIDPVANTVRLEPIPRMSRELLLDRLHLFSPDISAGAEGRFDVKIRYAAKLAPATVYFCDGGARVVFDEAQKSVTPGQSAVIYKGETVIGGGIIL